MTAAMRSGDSLRRDVLRMALTPPTTRRSGPDPLTDDDFLAVLTREVKTRRESIEAFQKGGRDDLARRNRPRSRSCASTCRSRSPRTRSEALVNEAVAATGAASARDMGKVMGWLAPRTRGRADGKRVCELVAQPLAPVDLAAHGRH